MLLSLACVCSLRAATERLRRSQPQKSLFSIRSAVLLAAFTAMFAYMNATMFLYLGRQAWFTGGTGNSFKVCCHKEHMSKHLEIRHHLAYSNLHQAAITVWRSHVGQLACNVIFS